MILFVNNNAGFTFLTYEQTVASLEIADLHQSQRIGKITLSIREILPSTWAISDKIKTHSLIIQDINISQRIEKITLDYVYELSIENISQGQEVGHLELIYKKQKKTKLQRIHSVGIAEIDQKQEIISVNLTERSYLSIDNTNQVQSVNEIVLTQSYNLQVVNISQSQDAESITLVVIVNIVMFLDSIIYKDVGVNSFMSYQKIVDSLLNTEIELSSQLNPTITVKGDITDRIIVKSLIYEKNI